MSFDVAAEAYGRFMGRFSEPLAELFLAEVETRRAAPEAAPRRALDVGAGPGALTSRLVDLLGGDAVTAVEPSASFVGALERRLPGVTVHRGAAEDLPLADDSVDLALAQLVVHFMTDPVAGLREMARATRPGGVLGACVWDHGGDRGPLVTFWRAARDLDPTVRDESGLAGTREGHLVELASAAGWTDLHARVLTVVLPMASFEEWWAPFTLGVGPAGAHVAGLSEPDRAALRARCEELMPAPPCTVEASAWCVTGLAP